MAIDESNSAPASSDKTANPDSAAGATKPQSDRKAQSSKAAKSSTKSKATMLSSQDNGGRKSIPRPYPRVLIEEAIALPLAIKAKNGGEPWSPEQVAQALGMGKGNPRFFYTAAASRDFGFTEGARDSKEIQLSDLGRKLAYAPTPKDEENVKVQGFLNIEVFKRVLEYYKGSELPEMKYLGNVLTDKFGLVPETHEEFAKLFQENCKYLGIGRGIALQKMPLAPADRRMIDTPADTVIYAEPEGGSDRLCFVIMPFSEKSEGRQTGFFAEVLKNLIAPAGRAAGFRVITAQRRGSDVIHATILRQLLDADLVVADLTDHNPNVLFELGVRMTHNKPVALIRAEGTKAIFDVDHLLRVYDYSPNLWPSTVEHDMPKLTEHIKGSWDARESNDTYMNLLLRPVDQNKSVGSF